MPSRAEIAEEIAAALHGDGAVIVIIGTPDPLDPEQTDVQILSNCADVITDRLLASAHDEVHLRAYAQTNGEVHRDA